jgi:hypothetical protein
MIVGLGDGGRGRKGCEGQGCGGDREKRRVRALAQLTRAHASGALAGLAGDDEQLGSLTPGDWWPNPKDVQAEEDAFDERLNAWMVDYQAVAAQLPAPVIQQIDGFIARWRDLRASFNVFSATRANAILKLEAEFNGYHDQVAQLSGRASSIAPAMASVDGKEVRADQIPPGSSTLDRVESIAKWGAILVGGIAAWKVASDLGIVAKVGGLLKGRSSGGEGASRRWGSAKL